LRKLLLHLDSSPHPSVFDRIVGFDGGADEVMSYGGVVDSGVRDLVHGAIFTRGPKDLRNTAIFIGGPDVSAGERCLAAAKKAFFGPLRVSLMLDANGSNTTAAAAVAKLQQVVGALQGRRAVVTGGGPVGLRAAGLLAKAGADVTVLSLPTPDPAVIEGLAKRFGGSVRGIAMPDRAQLAAALDTADVFLNAGPAGLCLCPRESWIGRPHLRAVADLNAVPPLGIEGIEVTDDGVEREGAITFGALGVGGLKMKIHKACIARLFERNDLVLDAETIAELARELIAPQD
jgi:hypothetical protein